MDETRRDEGRRPFPVRDFGSLAPGLARVSTIAGHWAVHDDTARALLAGGGATPPDEGVDLYAWEDVWRTEGAGYVLPSRYADYREDMIAVETLGRGGARDRARGLTRRGLVDLGPSALRDRLPVAPPQTGPRPRLTPQRQPLTTTSATGKAIGPPTASPTARRRTLPPDQAAAADQTGQLG